MKVKSQFYKPHIRSEGEQHDFNAYDFIEKHYIFYERKSHIPSIKLNLNK